MVFKDKIVSGAVKRNEKKEKKPKQEKDSKPDEAQA